MAITRRIFLGYMGGGLMTLATGKTAEKVASKLISDDSTFPWTVKKTPEYYKDPAPLKGVRYAMAIDTQACIGCRRCMYAVSYTHLRAHETRHDLVCRLLLEKKKNKNK